MLLLRANINDDGNKEIYSEAVRIVSELGSLRWRLNRRQQLFENR